VLTLKADRKNKDFDTTNQALADASSLLSRLCNSRKASSKLQEIIELTGVVARLKRAVALHDAGHYQSNLYGDRDHIENISYKKDMTNLIR